MVPIHSTVRIFLDTLSRSPEGYDRSLKKGIKFQ